MKLTGSQIILKKLIVHKVRMVFEFPGGSICPILDELAKYRKIKTICFRHEQAAIHAADAYARITKAPSVCMATSGPGASNLVTGIANAYMDSVPLVVITGQVAVWDLKKDRPVRQRGFQELDIVSVAKTITKKAFCVHRTADLAAVIDEAFFIASSGRPGPVLIDVPINVQYTACELKDDRFKFREKKLICPQDTIKEIVKKFIAAKKPLVLAGGGVILSSSKEELLSLFKKQKLVVAETLMGLASVPQDYPLNLGLVGYAGSRIADIAIKEADFVLGLGLRFDNRAFPGANKEFSRHCYIVHVDCDKNEFNHRVTADKAVFADVKLFLNAFIKELNKTVYHPDRGWIDKILSLKREAVPSKKEAGLKPQSIITKLSELLKEKNAVITTDVGQHQLWVAQYFKFRPSHSLVTSGGLGTMGFGLPAAIGAQFADLKAGVFNITSDGSFQMNIQELATLRDYKLPVKIILFNNRCLGLVRQIQEFAFCKRYVSTRVNSRLDFVKIARSYGIRAFCVKNPKDIDSALKEIVNAKENILVEFKIGEFENVYPVRVKGKIIYGHTQS